MKRVWFIVPVHGREELTRVCLRQLRRTCDAMKAYDLNATAVVIGTDTSLDVAYELGFATVARDNAYLGRRFNDGYQLACDPEFNPEPADYVVPCGSDDWVDPVIFQQLPKNGTMGTFQHMGVVNETRDKLARIKVGYKGGVGVRIIPRDLIQLAGYRPADEDRVRAIDTSTLMGLTTANDRRPPRMVALDVHALQIVDWKSGEEQLNSYAMLRTYRRGDETEDVYEALAEHYPAEALEEMQRIRPAAGGGMSVYEVTAKQEYRGHKPGDRFEAQLDRNAEARALRRGAIKLIRRSVPTLIEGSYRLPKQQQEEEGS